MLELITNPIVISVVLLCVLCLLRINVMFSLLISAIAGGLAGKLPIDSIMNELISGMGGNSETALSYILLGTFAAVVSKTGLAALLTKKVANAISSKKFILLWILVIMAILSQNLIPVHIAFIPILIPPLLYIMNRLRIDRRAAACALAFGLKAPYIAIPAGFGLIFQNLIANNMTLNGVSTQTQEIWQSTWLLGAAMAVALLISFYISYRKPRDYEELKISTDTDTNVNSPKFNLSHYLTMAAAVTTLIVQLFTGSLPLGAICGLAIIFITRCIDVKNMDNLFAEGILLMGNIAFIMLVASGYAAVMKATGGVNALVESVVPYMGSKVTATLLMMFVGLFITMGIGTSFGTIPILAVLYIPICAQMGFSTPSMIIVMAAAAALGDAGSPASDTTLGPTAGLNADGQHDHIRDTCIPTFIHYNTALLIAAVAAVAVFD